MSTPGFTVWVTGPEPARLHVVADEVARRLAARAVPAEVLDARTPGLAAMSDPAHVAILVAALLARPGPVTHTHRASSLMPPPCRPGTGRAGR